MYRIERQIGREKLILEWGKYAQRAKSAITARYGDTVVFTAVSTGPGRGDADFIQLFVDYRESRYASGKIPGGFIKREGRPSTKETLTSRLIDRALRPLFPKGYAGEVSVISLVLSADDKYDPAVLGIISAAAALSTAGVPISSVIAGMSVGMVDEKLIIFPTYEESSKGQLDLMVAGSKDNVIMVECGAREIPEEKMIEAIMHGHSTVTEVVGMIEELQKEIKITIPVYEATKESSPWVEKIFQDYGTKIEETLLISHKRERDEAMAKIREEILAPIAKRKEEKQAEENQAEEKNIYEEENQEAEISGAIGEVVKKTIRKMAKKGARVGNRKPQEVRKIISEVGMLPRTHGSAMFQRGETQALVVTTLGTTMDEQRVDGLGEEYTMKFMLHYNFPAFCVGETWPNRGPKRREIGHGALAERAIICVLPEAEVFPYTIRIVSDIMSSNGSSSMASVCGSTLALMDAGVPIVRPVAGIAMGLIKEGDDFIVLSDISGEEDHCGDMDFKVAGSQKGISALQMDIKIGGVAKEIVQKALEQAREGRLYILREMLSTLEKPRAEVSEFAPKIARIKIPQEKIGAVIGSGGKVIRQLQEKSGTKIEIEEDGTIIISGVNLKGVQQAQKDIEGLVEDAEVGRIYRGKVVSIKDFGAFVEILPGTEGLLHISEVADQFVRNIRDVVREGEEIDVKCIGIDPAGKIKLSRRGLDGEGGGEKEKYREKRKDQKDSPKDHPKKDQN